MSTLAEQLRKRDQNAAFAQLHSLSSTILSAPLSGIGQVTMKWSPGFSKEHFSLKSGHLGIAADNLRTWAKANGFVEVVPAGCHSCAQPGPCGDACQPNTGVIFKY